jgi:hypothetical protein
LQHTTSYDGLIAHYDAVIARFRELLPDVDRDRDRFPRLFAMLLSPVHGIHHWTRVGIYSLAIADALARQGGVKLSDPALLRPAALSAAFFHDCARLTEGNELDHGRAGEEVWRCWAARRGLPAAHWEAVSQALLFHVDHAAVDPAANAVTICLCNADRLDRVRLGQKPVPEWMYDDGVWPDLAPFAERLLGEVTLERVRTDLPLFSPAPANPPLRL